MVVGWIAIIYLFGGYRADVFGAGTEEYKRVLNAGLLDRRPPRRRLLPRQVPAVPRLLPLRLRLRRPGLILGRLRAAQGHPERPDPRAACSRASSSPGRRRTSTRSPPCSQRERWLGYQILGAVTPVHDDRAETPAGIPVRRRHRRDDRPRRRIRRRRHLLRRRRDRAPASRMRQVDLGARAARRPASSSPPASPTSPASGSGCARSAACRSCTSTRRPGPTPPGSGQAHLRPRSGRSLVLLLLSARLRRAP